MKKKNFYFFLFFKKENSFIVGGSDTEFNSAKLNLTINSSCSPETPSIENTW